MDALNKYFKNEANVSLIGHNAAGTKSVVRVSSYNSPAVYYVYDFEQTSIEALVSTEPELSSAINSEAKIVQVTTRDGTPITAYHYFPKGQERGAPLIVMPHGGPHIRDVFDFDYWAQYLVARGYQVVQMNFRGSSGYGREFEEAGYGEWGMVMRQLIEPAL